MEGSLLGRGPWWIEGLSRLKTPKSGIISPISATRAGIAEQSQAKSRGGLFLIPKMQRLRTNSPIPGASAK